MKKIFILLLIVILLFSGCSVHEAPKEQGCNNDTVKAVWITYYELEELLKNMSKSEFETEFESVTDYLLKIGFNTVTVQVRPCADAFYNSKIFPYSKYFVGKQSSEAPFDPLESICSICKSKNIKVEAWINPYRVSQDSNVEELDDSNIAKTWIKEGSSNVYISDSAIYFNPASADVTNLIVEGVVELIEKYEISAIHFDDYFYPTKKKTIDKYEYNKNGNGLSLADFRKNSVSKMLKAVKDAIIKTNKNVRFGVSPCGNIDYDINDLYADVIQWSKDNTYIDYICPQIYYGFKNYTLPFMSTVKKWIDITNIDLYIGLPMYKIGEVDEYAGEEGKHEFEQKDIIKRQIDYISKIDRVKGIYIFSLSSIKGHEEELAKLKEI